MATEPRYQVRALERGLAILDAFSLREPELSLSEIAERVGLPKSTAVRLLAILEAFGYLERSPATDHYRVGVRAFALGSIYIQSTSLEAEATPILRALAEECQQTANLGVLQGADVVHLAVVPPQRPIRFWAMVGQHERAYCTGLGKVLLAELDPGALERLVAEYGLEPRTPRTIRTLPELEDQLALIRERGYGLDDEESEPGLRCVAAPVRDQRGTVVAAVSVSGPAAEFDSEQLQAYRQAVAAAGNRLSARLGYQPAPLAVALAREHEHEGLEDDEHL